MKKPSLAVQNAIRGAISSARSLEQQYFLVEKTESSIAERIRLCTEIAFAKNPNPETVSGAQIVLTATDHTLSQFANTHPELAEQIDQIRTAMGCIMVELNEISETTDTVRETKPLSGLTSEAPTIMDRDDDATEFTPHIKVSLPQEGSETIQDRYGKPLERKGFTKLEKIGEGGMGIVLRARQESLGREVVIKTNKMSRDLQMVMAFKKEAMSAASIGGHPNIVTVHDTGNTIIDGQPTTYHVMEYIDGAQDLKKFLDELENLQLPTEVALIFVLQLARGLSAAHEKGVIHRDVKPANALLPREIQKLLKQWKSKEITEATLIEELQKNSGIKVSDFGLAGIRSREPVRTEEIQPSDDESISSGAIIGSPGYIPPEALDDAAKAGKPWDVYSLGVVLYQLLFAGKRPLEHSYHILPGAPITNYISKMLKEKEKEKKEPAVAGPEKDPNIKDLLYDDKRNKEILALLQEMTAYNPEERPTMAKVVKKLERILNDRSEKSMTIQQLKKWLKGIAAAIIVSVPGVIGGFKYQRAQYLVERRQTFNTIQATFQATGRRCYCHEIEAMEKLNGGSPDPEEVPTEEQYQAMLKCLREKDREVHPH